MIESHLGGFAAGKKCDWIGERLQPRTLTPSPKMHRRRMLSPTLIPMRRHFHAMVGGPCESKPALVDLFGLQSWRAVKCVPSPAFDLQKESFRFYLARLSWMVLRVDGNRSDHAIEFANRRQRVAEFPAVGRK